MGTRSKIGVQDLETGKITAAYCQFDGYPRHMGRKLIQFYNSRSKATQVAGLGYIWSLKENLEDTMKCSLEEGARRTRISEAEIYDNADDFYQACVEGWEEHAYLYFNGAWHWAKIGGSAGPFMVSDDDPKGEKKAEWIKLGKNKHLTHG